MKTKLREASRKYLQNFLRVLLFQFWIDGE